MNLNLSDTLSEPFRTVEMDVPVEIDCFRSSIGSFSVKKKGDCHIKVEHVKESEKKLVITGQADITLNIPCDRCLEDVEVPFSLDFEKHVNLEAEDDKESDETNYIDGYNLDVDKLLYNEILIGWPMKVLCSEDCKGICSVCGQNLNEGTCDCEDTGLDPRMSVIRDVFKNYKEV